VERRSTEPLAELSRRFDDLCVRAVDPCEIAAGLEAAGFTDTAVAARYGVPDVFALAEHLFAATPRRLAGTRSRATNPWRERPVRHLARGMAFGCPGIVYVAALPGATGPAERWLLVFALTLGWAVGQAAVFLGYLLDGRGDRAGARAVLRAGLVVAVLAALALVALCGGRVGPVTVGLAAGQVVYLPAAAVVLMLGHELLVLLALVPGLVGAGLLLTARSSTSAAGAGPDTAVLVGAGGIAVSLLVVVAVAVWLTRRPRWRRPGGPSTADAWLACWHGGYGVLAATMVCLPAVLPTSAGAPASGTDGTWLLPLTWSMGVAEWLILRFRRRAHDLLDEHGTPAGFAGGARRTLAAGAACYVVVLVVLTVAVPPVTGGDVGAVLREPVLPAVGLLLGFGFYLALLGISLGAVRRVVTALAGSVATGTAVAACWSAREDVVVAPLALAATLAVVMTALVADPTRHR